MNTVKTNYMLIGNLYMINETYLRLNVAIVKADGSLPDASAIVSVVNNTLHSIFDSCRIYVNDTLLNKGSRDYAYKSYISSTLSYPTTCKNSWMHCQGKELYAQGQTNYGCPPFILIIQLTSFNRKFFLSMEFFQRLLSRHCEAYGYIFSECWILSKIALVS